MLFISQKPVLTKRVLVLMLVFVLIFNIAFKPQKADAFLPVVIAGGLSLGQALFYTAAVGATGYALYDAYESWDDYSLGFDFLKNVGARAWNDLSSSAQAGWAALEEKARGVGAKVSLSVEQWNQSMLLGYKAYSGSLDGPVPMYNLPNYAEINSAIGSSAPRMVASSYVAAHGLIGMDFSGSEFAFIPTLNIPGLSGQVMFEWAYKHPTYGWVLNWVPPSGATAFKSEKLSFSASYGKFYKSETILNNQLVGWDVVVPSYEDIMRVLRDQLAAYKAYLSMVYGDATTLSLPWVPSIPQDKAEENSKPVAIPIPAGALTVPGSLTLTGDAVIPAVQEMVGTTDIPGTSNPDWGSTPSDKLNFEPLKLAVGLFTTKFPFSIPWDIKNQLSVFDVQPQTPVLKVNEVIPLFNTKMNLKFNIDFSLFNPIIPIVRWFLIIIFDLGLILSLRKFLPE